MKTQDQFSSDEADLRKKSLSLGTSFINPQGIIDSLEIAEGMVVADFGCGTGYFSFPLAKKVGMNGRVYALDILKEKLEVVESQAKILGLHNLIVKRANLELSAGSKLEAESLDWVFLVNMLYQNKARRPIFVEANRVLKKGGKLLVVDWKVEGLPFGPAKGLRVLRETVLADSREGGFKLLAEPKVGDYHFGIIFEK